MKKSSRLGVVGRLVLALLAVFAFGAVVATAAQAEEAPAYKVNGKRLPAGESKEIVAKLDGEVITLESEVAKAPVKISCKALKLAVGSRIIGAAAKAPGTSEEVVEFEECKPEGLGSECKVVGGKITTEKLKNELVLADKEGGAGEKEDILVEFLPVAGEIFALIKLEKCSGVTKLEVRTGTAGRVLGSIFTDPEVSEGKASEQTTLGNPVELTSYLINFPDEPKSFWLASGGTLTLETFETFKLNTAAAKLTGKVLVALKSGEKYGVEGSA